MFFKTILKIISISIFIKKNKIDNLFFIDSYGGIAHLFLLLEKFNNKNKKIFLLCNNKDIAKNLKINGKFSKNVKIDFYEFEKHSLLYFLYFIPLLLIKFLNIKILNFYSYKLVSDPVKLLLINIFYQKKNKNNY